jgi:hypothetical protein
MGNLHKVESVDRVAGGEQSSSSGCESNSQLKDSLYGGGNINQSVDDLDGDEGRSVVGGLEGGEADVGTLAEDLEGSGGS